MARRSSIAPSTASLKITSWQQAWQNRAHDYNIINNNGDIIALSYKRQRRSGSSVAA